MPGYSKYCTLESLEGSILVGVYGPAVCEYFPRDRSSTGVQTARCGLCRSLKRPFSSQILIKDGKLLENPFQKEHGCNMRLYYLRSNWRNEKEVQAQAPRLLEESSQTEIVHSKTVVVQVDTIGPYVKTMVKALEDGLKAAQQLKK